MIDREALTAALETVERFGFTDAVLITLLAAARERLAELPPYADELVERLAGAIGANQFGDGAIPHSDFLAYRSDAIVVLDALNETP